MPHERDEKAPGREETRRGEHNELHYYNADEEQSFDERGSETEGQGEDEGSPDQRRAGDDAESG